MATTDKEGLEPAILSQRNMTRGLSEVMGDVSVGFLRRLRPGTPLSLSLRADLVGRFTGAVTASLVLALAGSMSWPGSIEAQAGPGSIHVAPVRPLHALEGDPAAVYSRRMGLVRSSLDLGAVATSHADSLAAYSVAVDTAWALVLMAPDDADAHYIYAVAVGQRLELAGTREKIRLGAVTRREAEAALALDPDHAGAHHVLGRLSAATMRLGFVARFVARRILGAGAMDGASWELAEYHFTRARDLEPENPRHLMELGALYSDTNRPAEALEALKEAIAAPRVEVGDSLAAERAIQLMASLDCQSCTR